MGGSEALVLFVRPPRVIVRKIWSERLISAEWNPDGKGVMSPPLEKAKLQVDYLMNLPDAVKRYFPEVYDFREIKTYDVDTGGMLVERREFICDQSYIPGIEVSTFVERYRLCPKIDICPKYRDSAQNIEKDRLGVERRLSMHPPAYTFPFVSLL
jgi:hypothetical protein